MTMADIICPICNRVNESSAERCWYCQAILIKDQPTGTGNDPENDKEKNQIGSSQYSEQAPASGNNEEIPDWLARIRQLEKEEHEPPAGVNPFQNGELPKEESPDWLNDFRFEEDSSLESTRQQPEKGTSTGNEEGFFSKDNLPEPHPSEKIEEADAFDSLLAELGIGAASSIEEDSTSESIDETPAVANEQVESDYLERLGFEEHQNQEDTSPQSISGSEFPEKVSDSSEESDEVLEFPWEEEKVTPSMEVPQPVEEPQPEIESEQTFQAESKFEPVEEPDLNYQADLELEPEPEPEPTSPLEPEIEPAGVPESTPEPDLPAWMKSAGDDDLHGDLPTLDSSGIIPPINGTPTPVSFDDDDLPEWLSLDQPEEKKKTGKPKTETAPGIEQDAGKLERAHLPAWLHAIRPVEAVTPLQPVAKSSGEEETPAEKGILAGIEGVLRSTDLSNQIKKPPVYSAGIEISERQRQNVMLFRSLLEGGTPYETIGASPKVPVKSNVVLRIVVTLALLAAVLLPLFSYTSIGITPVLYPAEVVNTFGAVQTMQSGKPVLLAAHFEAGLAGEMEWTSRAVIEHLMMRNIPMTVISTNTIGYAVLEEEVRDISLTETAYAVDEQVVNLGYLPGGTLGILSLTQNLHEALPYTTSVQPAWNQPVLQGINNLSDFGAVIVFTDNADIVKTWVEQVGTSSNTPPILAVVSAQAAPMTQPYYDSGQIKGFVAGMNGSQAYEQILQKPFSSSLVFGSFQLTLLATALIVFLGGAASLVLSSGTGTKKVGGR